MTTKQVITDLDEARKLAAAGLLWYSASNSGGRPVHWVPLGIDHTGNHWQFYLLLEE